jgi:hypothetical protein
MLTLEDCIALSDLTLEEIGAIADEHLPETIAAAAEATIAATFIDLLTKPELAQGEFTERTGGGIDQRPQLHRLCRVHRLCRAGPRPQLAGG